MTAGRHTILSHCCHILFCKKKKKLCMVLFVVPFIVYQWIVVWDELHHISTGVASVVTNPLILYPRFLLVNSWLCHGRTCGIKQVPYCAMINFLMVLIIKYSWFLSQYSWGLCSHGPVLKTYCKTAVIPLLTHWSHHSLALSHWYNIWCKA